MPDTPDRKTPVAGSMVPIHLMLLTALDDPAESDTTTSTSRQRRSRRYRHLAERAHNRQHHRLASLITRLARFTDRHDPDNLILHATILRELDKDEQALQLHHKAHRLMTRHHLSEPRKVAENAYEAACTAGRLNREGPTLQWIKIALSYEPELADEVQWEPDLGIINQNPEFKALAMEPLLGRESVKQ